jgi:leucyl-tRNA synthetase
MENKYDHRLIEKKWQEYWKKHKTFRAEVDVKKPKYYALDMFPYPSGAGLHVGHVTGYTGSDIMARYMRQKGYNVLHPMGWDSFGLPAEQYAIRTGTHPQITTEKNINTYRRQLEALGFSYDWDREIATSESSYYKWTQWIFNKLYEKGLAYEAEFPVNFCPALGTVLANEEVEDGKSKEGGFPVERRPLRQWVLKITAYADRLLQDLEGLDWPEHLKRLQINWIGKSEGAKIHFKEKETLETITVFTTRPDTLFGVSYVVLAPEHPLVAKITTKGQKQAVDAYQKEVQAKSEFQRTEVNQDKTGVWTGAYALHPITGKEVPIWTADYVLADYGTGAVMGVPSDDERDFHFAKKHNLPILGVYEPDAEILRSGKDLPWEEFCLFVKEKYWSTEGTIIQKAHTKPSLKGLNLEQAKETITRFLTENGKGELCISYKLRDWLFSRQRYWGEPIPILHFADGSKRALGLDELPLCPPKLEDFKPSPTGESPLAKVPEWVHITDSKTGKKAVRETNTMPQWAGSCWYYLRFLDPHNEKEAWSKEAEKYWMPVDLYIGGAEHATLHLLYARFWHKVLYDIGAVHTSEPFKSLRNQGLVTSRSYKKKGGSYVEPFEVVEKDGKYFHKDTNEPLISQIDKMSKSKLNGVSPDEMIEEFGADSLRLYEMFMGPFDREKIWNTDAVMGCRRFLNRFYDMGFSSKITDDTTEEALVLGHKLLHQVTKDIEAMQFNTAIARMMEFLNAFLPLASYPKVVVKMATQALHPFAPHIAEEIWQRLGENSSIAHAPLAKIEEKYLIEDTAIYVVQVNGKLRGRLELPKGKTQEEILDLAKNDPAVAKHISGTIANVIFVPNKLLNIVVKPG